MFPVNLLDPVWKRFGYGHYGQCVARIGPEGICWVRLLISSSVPFFQRRPGSNHAKLGWI